MAWTITLPSTQVIANDAAVDAEKTAIGTRVGTGATIKAPGVLTMNALFRLVEAGTGKAWMLENGDVVYVPN